MPNSSPPTLGDVRTFLDSLLLADSFEGDQNGSFRHPWAAYDETVPVTRLGLALEPWPELATWAETRRLDALFLHRPWRLRELTLPVLAYHAAFDEHLTTGYNPRLAQVLGLSELAVLGYKAGRPLGMIGDLPRTPISAFRARAEAVFGALEGVYEDFYGAQAGEVSRACVVGAMRRELICEAAARGAQVYLTGEYRKGAARAVAETGLTVFEIGHARSERWGLRELAGVLRGHFAGLEVVLWPQP